MVSHQGDGHYPIFLKYRNTHKARKFNRTFRKYLTSQTGCGEVIDNQRFALARGFCPKARAFYGNQKVCTILHGALLPDLLRPCLECQSGLVLIEEADSA